MSLRAAADGVHWQEGKVVENRPGSSSGQNPYAQSPLPTSSSRRPTSSNRRVSASAQGGLLGKNRPAPIRTDMIPPLPSLPSPMSGSLSGNMLHQQAGAIFHHNIDSPLQSPGGMQPDLRRRSSVHAMHPSSPHRVNQMSYLQHQQMQGPPQGQYGSEGQLLSPSSGPAYADMMQRSNGAPYGSVSSLFSSPSRRI